VIEGRYKRFIIAKPVVDVVTGKEVTSVEAGGLYYDLASAYLKDILTGLVEWQEVEKLVKEGKLFFADAHYLRGRTFDETVIFVDDAQAVMPESAIDAFMRIVAPASSSSLATRYCRRVRGRLQQGCHA
jgi:phosphate starvation-inducible protein PhoH